MHLFASAPTQTLLAELGLLVAALVALRFAPRSSRGRQAQSLEDWTCADAPDRFGRWTWSLRVPDGFGHHFDRAELRTWESERPEPAPGEDVRQFEAADGVIVVQGCTYLTTMRYYERLGHRVLELV